MANTQVSETHINLRSNAPITFGSDESRLAYTREVEQLRARVPVGSFVVGPLVSVRSRRGTLAAGQAITRDDALATVDVEGKAVCTPGEQWRRWLLDGSVLEGL